MATHYETKATNTGGRKGHVYTDDKAIDVDVLPPQQADGNATNPEQLFAAGYASCFNGAFDLILKQNKVRDAEPKRFNCGLGCRNRTKDGCWLVSARHARYWCWRYG